jgi:hypothetical protein
MDKEAAKNLAIQLEANPTDEWLDEAVQFLYKSGYSSGDDVSMLLAFAAYRDVRQILEILREEEPTE